MAWTVMKRREAKVGRNQKNGELAYHKKSSRVYRFYKGVHQLGGEGNGTTLRYSCLENPMDGGAWQAAVHVVAKNET